MIQVIQPFLISLAIGLVIGTERERSHPAGMKPYGVRTFVLFSLLGTLSAEIEHVYIAAAIAVFVFTAIIIGYLRATEKNLKKHVGITTEVAAGAVFCLGYVAEQRPLLASLLALTVLILLLGRDRMHTFVREQLRQREIQAAVIILIIALGVLSFLPNKTIDTFGLFNPRQFGFLVMLLALVQFGGYISIRVFGRRLGMVLTGFFGGLVSSTAVYATLPQLTRRDKRLVKPAVAGAVFAQMGMLVQLSIILSAAAPELIRSLFLPIAAMLLVGTLSVLLVLKTSPTPDTLEHHDNPLDLKSVLRLALFIGAMLLLMGAIQVYYSTDVLRLASFIGGLAEVHGVSLATAALFVTKKLTLAQARVNVAFAISATYASKFVLLAVLGRNRFAVITAGFLILMLSAGTLTFYLLGYF